MQRERQIQQEVSQLPVIRRHQLPRKEGLPVFLEILETSCWEPNLPLAQALHAADREYHQALQEGQDLLRQLEQQVRLIPVQPPEAEVSTATKRTTGTGPQGRPTQTCLTHPTETERTTATTQVISREDLFPLYLQGTETTTATAQAVFHKEQFHPFSQEIDRTSATTQARQPGLLQILEELGAILEEAEVIDLTQDDHLHHDQNNVSSEPTTNHQSYEISSHVDTFTDSDLHFIFNGPMLHANQRGHLIRHL
jgi:hypothetical protein